MNMLVPFGSLTPDAWHSALAKGNIPKETIIAHTDFTTTSAIAKRFVLSTERDACMSQQCYSRPWLHSRSPFTAGGFKSSRNFCCSGVLLAAQVKVFPRMRTRVAEAQGSLLSSPMHLLQVSQRYLTIVTSWLPARSCLSLELSAQTMSLVVEIRPIQCVSQSAPH